MSKEWTGGCFCGAVRFSIVGNFSNFHHCHCHQCQRLTGTAFAANLFSTPEKITWQRGQNMVKKYEHPTRQFSNAFCLTCGASLPWVNQSGTTLVIPAGSLDEPPPLSPRANIFYPEKAPWLDEGLKAPAFDAFPT